MSNCKIGRIILVVLLVVNFLALGSLTYVNYSQAEFITVLENKIDILAQYQEERIQEIEDIILAVMRSIVNIDNRGNKVEEEVIAMKKYQKELEEKVNSKKSIDLADVKKIKEANVLIRNITAGCLGSGTHIKIDGEDYVLTVAHLIDETVEDNLIYIVSDFGTTVKAEVVSFNVDKDIALLKVSQLKNRAYLEISDISPEAGSEVIVVGNPSGIVDMITDGIVTKIDDVGYYIITNKVYFGNSGGALLYKGKIVGVLSQLVPFSALNPFGVITQNYGRAVSLKEIKNFLKEVKEMQS